MAWPISVYCVYNAGSFVSSSAAHERGELCTAFVYGIFVFLGRGNYYQISSFFQPKFKNLKYSQGQTVLPPTFLLSHLTLFARINISSPSSETNSLCRVVCRVSKLITKDPPSHLSYCSGSTVVGIT